jgi:hypothetical protein
VYFLEMTPEEQIDAWVSADREWVEANYDILASAYQHFLSNGEWPTVEQLIRLRARIGILDNRPQQVLEGRPLIPGQGPQYRLNAIALSIRHLVYFPEAEYLTSLVARATRFAIILIGSDDETPTLNREQMIEQPPRLLPGSVALLPRFLTVMTSDIPRPFHGYHSVSDNDWSLDIDVVTALAFSNVVTIGDFIESQRAVIKGSLKSVSPSLKMNEPTFLSYGGPLKDEEPTHANSAERSQMVERATINRSAAPSDHERKPSLLSRAFNNPWTVGIIVFLVIGVLFVIYADLVH